MNTISIIQIPLLNKKQNKLDIKSNIVVINLKPLRMFEEMKEKIKIVEIQNKNKTNEISELNIKIQALREKYLKQSENCKELSKTYNDNLGQKDRLLKANETRISQLELLNENINKELNRLKQDYQKIESNFNELNQNIDTFEVIINENIQNIKELFSIIELGENLFTDRKNSKFLSSENYFVTDKFEISNNKIMTILGILKENQQKVLFFVLGFTEFFHKFKARLLNSLDLELCSQQLDSTSHCYEKFSSIFPYFCNFLIKSTELVFIDILKIKDMIKIRSEENQKLTTAIMEKEKCNEDELIRIKNEIEKKSEIIIKLNKENDDINNKLKIEKEENKKIEETNNELSKKLDILLIKKNSLENELAQTNQNLAKQNAQFLLLEEEIKIIKKDNSQLKDNTKNLELSKDDFENLLKEKENQKVIINNLNDKISLMNNEKIKLENENLNLRKQIEEIMHKMNSIELLNKEEITSRDKANEELIQSINKQKDQLDEYKENYNKLVLQKNDEITKEKIEFLKIFETYEKEQKDLKQTIVRYEKSIAYFDLLYEDIVMNCKNKIEEFEQLLKKAYNLGTLDELNKLYSSMNNDFVQVENSQLIIDEHFHNGKNQANKQFKTIKDNYENIIKDAFHLANNKLDEFVKGKEKIVIFITNLHNEKCSKVIENGNLLVSKIEQFNTKFKQFHSPIDNAIAIEKIPDLENVQETENNFKKNKTNFAKQPPRLLIITSFPPENIFGNQFINSTTKKVFINRKLTLLKIKSIKRNL